MRFDINNYTEFTKADLKDGMVVEYDDGRRRLVLGDRFIGNNGNAFMHEFNEDLKFNHSYIVINKIYESTAWYLNDIFKDDCLTLIWERKPEPVEMTLAEVCKALGKEIKIVKE